MDLKLTKEEIKMLINKIKGHCQEWCCYICSDCEKDCQDNTYSLYKKLKDLLE